MPVPLAILELMLMDDGLRDLVLQRASASIIRRHVMPHMQTMRQAGWWKVVRGITTPEEVIRATQVEEELDSLA